MQLGNVTDSLSAGLREPQKCASCNSASRLENGLCLNCLLSSALQGAPISSAKATFKDALAAMEIRHTKSRIGDYEILEEIGRGGMGVIYRAREPHSERIVALKCILSYHVDSDQAVARFRREAETATRLDHPNIVPIYYVGTSQDGLPFLTMKLASGGSLLGARNFLRQEPRKSVFLMAKVALAVQYAHEQGVLHRDLKPGNILLDQRGEPLVSDFGLAKWQDTASGLTRSLTIFGTPGYIAPEQAGGPAKRLTAAADVYSLGAILFELLTGGPPFSGEHALAVVRQAAENPAPKLRSLAPHLDRDLETICARCLEREPTARYPSAAALAHDLENWLDRLPITARPVGIGVLLSRWIGRNRALTFIISMLIILAGVLLVWQVRVRNLQSAVQETTLAARSVLVVPFLDLDRVTPNSLLAKSVSSSLQQELNRFGPARVGAVPSGSSLEWGSREEVQKAGQEANARTVLTGTERTIDGKKQISIRLLDAASGEPLLVHLLQTKGQKDSTNIIFKEIARPLYAILSRKDWSNLVESKADPGLRSNAAKEAIIAGRELMSRDTVPDFDRAIALFKKAIRIEPRSWLAHSYLAIAATTRTHYISDRTFLTLGEEEARKAVELSPDSSDAHRALAGVHYRHGQFGDAFEEQLRTLELGGLEEKNLSFIGLTLDMLGRSDQALRWYNLARKLERSAGEVDAVIGDCWAKLCEDNNALQAYTRAAELQPNAPQGRLGICRLRLLEGNLDGARQLYRESGWKRGDLSETDQMAAQIEFFARNFDVAEKLYRELSRADPEGGGSFYGAVTYQSALGRARQALGDSVGGKALLERCRVQEQSAFEREPANPEAAYRLAAVEASLAERERSLQNLRAAVNLGWIDYRSLDMDPRFDAVRQTPEFQVIIKELSSKVTQMRLKLNRFFEIAQY
jgi:serine/threonine protein kinase/tetratricopeptide (TPR) repeat protein